MNTNRTERKTSYVNTQHDFNLTDEKNRNVGTMELIFTVDYVEPTEPTDKYWCGYPVPAGTRYGFRLHATRNGRSYGASNGYQEFATADEREIALKAAIERSRKSYTRKYGVKA